MVTAQALSLFVRSGDVTIHALDHGGEGPPLILLHGLTANARFFDALVEDGLGTGARVVAVDLRGRGSSDKPNSGYTMADHAADVLAVLDELGLANAVVAGHSFGGLLTYHLAAHHPSRVEAAVVLDAPAEVDPSILAQIQPSLDRLERTWPSFDAYLEMIRRMPYYDGWWDPRIEAFYRADVTVAADGTVRPTCNPHHISQAIAATMVPDWPAIQASLDLPVLLVAARHGFGPPGSPPILTSDEAAIVGNRLRRGRVEQVDGNHMTAFYDPGSVELARMMLEFIRGTTR